MSVETTAKARPLAVLVGLQLPDVSEQEHAASLTELTRLVTTLGFEVIATLTQRRSAPSAATVIGEGKLKELARLTGGTGVVESYAPKRKIRADAQSVDDEDDADDDSDDTPVDASSSPPRKADKVVFDHELTPTQLRNLSSATGAEVLDRTGVIVEIFHRHAQTREARLQVEIARLRYLAPRIRMTGAGERQGGGIGSKGVGETAHELDRRRIRDRIAELQRELVTIRDDQGHRRARRRDHARVALVGYTNAGKSSLMRALTGSPVLVADKLFATLDTTVRALQPETHPRILLSDTVGFIKKLPHDLVASFRSTLDEAADASLLLLVVDAADPTFRSHIAVVSEVLAEIGADDLPTRVVLNKIDCVDEDGRAALARELPDALQVSALESVDIATLREIIVNHFEAGMVDADFLVPYGTQGMIGEIRRNARVLSERYEEDGAVLRIRAVPEVIARLRKFVAQDEP